MRILEDPISDPQWAALLERHPAASIFHTPGWLNALRQTYGYHPFVITASAGSSLDNGLVVCQVNSWVSRRLVSVPFSDHCDPLVNGGLELNEILTYEKIQVHQLSPEERKAFEKDTQPVYAEFRRSFGPKSSELLDKVLAELKKIRGEN